MTLALVADAAYPFDYSVLPAGTHAVAGYVGGDTPHVWTLTEIATVRGTGRQWWAIWTAPSTGQTLTAGQGTWDAQRMVTALNERRYPKPDPVFYDVEHATWNASPGGARAAIGAWKTGLRNAGWPNAYAYVPLDAGFDWIAWWTNTPPAALPAGWVGQQYQGNAFAGRCDLSVFDLTQLGAADMPLTQAEIQAVAKAVWDYSLTDKIRTPGVPHPSGEWLTSTGVRAVEITNGATVAEVTAALAALPKPPTAAQIVAAIKADPPAGVTLTDTQIQQIAAAVAGAVPAQKAVSGTVTLSPAP